MRCQDARRRISRSLDGETPGFMDRFLDRHLARCPDCREWRDCQASLPDRLFASIGVSAAPDDWRSIQARLASPSPRPGWSQSALRPFWLARPGRLALAGTLACVIAGGVLLGSSMGSSIFPGEGHGAHACPAISEALADLPFGSPGVGLAGLLEVSLEAPSNGRHR